MFTGRVLSIFGKTNRRRCKVQELFQRIIFYVSERERERVVYSFASFNVTLVTVVYNFPFILATSTFHVCNRRFVALVHNLPNYSRISLYRL